MLLLPTYVNVFMIYAFCNLHDLSWGTKGDNLNNGQQVLVLDPAQMAKQQQSSSKNGLGDGPSVVEMEMPTQDSADSNRAYEDMMNSLKREEKKEKQKRDAKTKTDDYFRLYRTRIVLFWLFCNLVIVFVFTNPIVSKLIVSSDQSGANHPYLTFIFWSVTALAAVRLVGCIFFLMEWVLDFVSDVWSKGKVFDPSARHRHHQQQQQPQQQPGRAIGGQHYRR